jgi:hypothetical protein
MSLRAQIIVVGSVLVAWAAIAHVQGDRASEQLAQAREAIGGEARLRAVHSLSLEADSTVTGGVIIVRRNPDDSQATRVEQPETQRKVRIDILLPDKFLMTLRGRGPASIRGVNGKAPIVNREILSRPILTDPRLLDRLTAQHHRQFMLYMIGLLVMPPEHYGVQFADAGEEEGGRADVVRATGPYNLAVQLFLDKETHRPRLLAFREPPRSASFKEAAKPTDAGQTDARDQPLFKSLEGPAPALPANQEMQIAFADHRPVDGILLPFRITTTFGSSTDEWRISKYDVNPPLKPKLFEK